MADNYHACALRLSPGQDWERVVFSGGMAQKLERLRALILARFDCPYRLYEGTEDTLIALLALALVIDGRAPSVAAAIDDLRTQAEPLIEAPA
jgi:hypothetical protein